jgi:hypothetical protein
MHSVCVVDLYVTVNYIKILSVAQQCFYGKFMSSKQNKLHVRISFLSKLYSNQFALFQTSHIKAALKQKKARLLVAPSRFIMERNDDIIRYVIYNFLKCFSKTCSEIRLN